MKHSGLKEADCSLTSFGNQPFVRLQCTNIFNTYIFSANILNKKKNESINAPLSGKVTTSGNIYESDR